MKKILFNMILALCIATTAQAIPNLQVGAPSGPGDSGTYADYQSSSTDPTETDTAIIYGNTLFVAGDFKPNTIALGGKYIEGLDWSYFGFNTAFDGAGAILMATVPEFNVGTLTIDGNGSIYSTDTYLDGFDTTNNHDPIKDNDPDKSYLFFDIGNFSDLGTIYNFDDETGTGSGEVKELTIDTSGYDWIHFDVFALLTDNNGNTGLVSTLETNPRSKDVTWKEGTPVPEPSTMMLLGSGLMGLAAYGRKRFKK